MELLVIIAVAAVSIARHTATIGKSMTSFRNMASFQAMPAMENDAATHILVDQGAETTVYGEPNKNIFVPIPTLVDWESSTNFFDAYTQYREVIAGLLGSSDAVSMRGTPFSVSTPRSRDTRALPLSFSFNCSLSKIRIAQIPD